MMEMIMTIREVDKANENLGNVNGVVFKLRFFSIQIAIIVWIVIINSNVIINNKYVCLFMHYLRMNENNVRKVNIDSYIA